MGNKQSAPGEPEKKLSIHDFEFLILIGRGAFGKVWQVKKKDTGKIYAMKVLDKKDVVKQDLVEHTRLERDVMASFSDCPFIVSMHWAFQSEEKLYFVLDYIGGGNLFQLLCATPEGYFPEEVGRFYASEVLYGLEVMHAHEIVYRDLKLENILLTSEGHAVLTDFGLSHSLKNKERVQSFSGTAVYLAPEILLDKEGVGHGKSVDFWCFGVMLHLILTGSPPFWSENHKELFDMIAKSEPPLTDELLSENARDLLRKLLVKDPLKRLGCGPEGIKEIKSHPFFENVDWENLIKLEVVPPVKPLTDAAEESRKRSQNTTLEMPSDLNRPLRTRKKGKINQFTESEEAISRAFRGFSFVGMQGKSPLAAITEKQKQEWAKAAEAANEGTETHENSEEPKRNRSGSSPTAKSQLMPTKPKNRKSLPSGQKNTSPLAISAKQAKAIKFSEEEDSKEGGNELDNKVENKNENEQSKEVVIKKELSSDVGASNSSESKEEKPSTQTLENKDNAKDQPKTGKQSSSQPIVTIENDPTKDTNGNLRSSSGNISISVTGNSETQPSDNKNQVVIPAVAGAANFESKSKSRKSSQKKKGKSMIVNNQGAENNDFLSTSTPSSKSKKPGGSMVIQSNVAKESKESKKSGSSKSGSMKKIKSEKALKSNDDEMLLSLDTSKPIPVGRTRSENVKVTNGADIIAVAKTNSIIPPVVTSEENKKKDKDKEKKKRKKSTGNSANENKAAAGNSLADPVANSSNKDVGSGLSRKHSKGRDKSVKVVENGNISPRGQKKEESEPNPSTSSGSSKGSKTESSNKKVNKSSRKKDKN